MSRHVINDDARHSWERPGLGLLLVFLLIAAGRGGQAPATPPAPRGQDVRTEPDLLKKAVAYCRRLQTASLDFVCREEITESVPRWTGQSEYTGRADFKPILISGSPYKHRLVYDYQFIRAGDEARETRTLIEEDGNRRNLPNAVLMTRLFRYENILFGPAALLDDRNFGRNDFTIEAESEIDGRLAVAIAARPRQEAGLRPLPFGRMWVSPADGAVLKIEWDGRTLESYAAIEAQAKKLKATPRLTMTSEFGFEKNGLRFPSRHTIVEAYDREKKDPIVKAKLDVEYVGYKFFTVETATDFK